jgi:hypothetical protein
MVEVAPALSCKQVLLDYVGLVGSVTETNVNERSPRLRPGCRVALTIMELEDLARFEGEGGLEAPEDRSH